MPRDHAALGPAAEIVAHADRRTRPHARQERFDAEFAEAAKGSGTEPGATPGHRTGSATAP
ncbi:hypothetical protein ACIPC1_12155 [Streptomyces sp. NPDC087263]|uniref:hypothetical protein n=1 Tax=Streptomyces sp. NPDC087263 TaxID=3365773 RepID=UPI00380C67D6